MHKVRHNNHHSHEDKPLQSWSRNLATKYLKNLERIAKLRELINFVQPKFKSKPASRCPDKPI